MRLSRAQIRISAWSRLAKRKRGEPPDGSGAGNGSPRSNSRPQAGTAPAASSGVGELASMQDVLAPWPRAGQLPKAIFGEKANYSQALSRKSVPGTPQAKSQARRRLSAGAQEPAWRGVND